MAKHISIFTQNKPGRLDKITEILSDNSINLRALSLASAGEFGVIKILVNNPEEAKRVLKDNSITAAARDIIIAVVEDRPGGLHELLKILRENSINIEDCYGFICEKSKEAAIIIETTDVLKARDILERSGIKVLSDSEVYSF